LFRSRELDERGLLRRRPGLVRRHGPARLHRPVPHRLLRPRRHRPGLPSAAGGMSTKIYDAWLLPEGTDIFEAAPQVRELLVPVRRRIEAAALVRTAVLQGEPTSSGRPMRPTSRPVRCCRAPASWSNGSVSTATPSTAPTRSAATS